MTLEQVLHKFSRSQVTTSIGILALLASGSIELSAPKPAPRGMKFQPEKALAVEPVGAGATAFNAQQARPTALASADFDSDGIKDLAVGYGLNKGGEIAVMRGNLDAIAPRSKESWTNAGFGRYADAFLPQANMIPVPVEPDQLIVADVNGDGYLDLVFAANNGKAIYVLAGNGKGEFTLQQPVNVQGTITALAAYRPGDKNAADALVVGVKTSKGFAAELYRMERGGFVLNAGYAMPGAVTAIATANLDNDLTPDAALIAGGQVVVLHGASALAGKARLEILPVSDAVSLTTGSFLFDRHAGLQLAVLTSDGTVHFLAHEGFDPRPFTTPEITAARRNAMRRENSPALAQMAGNTGNAPWTEVETLGGVAPAGFAGTAPVLLRARAAGSGQDDVLAVNGPQEEIAIVRHPASGALTATSGVVTRSPLTSSDVVAAIAQRVSPLGTDGIVMLKRGSPRPEITSPAQSNTMFVNTQTDSLDANDALRCTAGSAETCSLRDAITYANADASVNITGGTSDTIEIPAGTYPLTYNAGSTDANNNAVTHLEILGPMTLVGDPSGVTINAQSNDVVFTINPGPYGSYNPSGDSYVFDTTFENLAITGGQNFNNPANSSTGMPNNVGGGINWDADGTGNLTLTNCAVNSNTNGWGDGGGIWFFNSAGGGSGTLTLSGGGVSNNSTSEIGGGIYQATAPAGFSATSVAFAGNTASPSVNTNDPGGASGADDAGAIYLSAVPEGSGIPSATISGGSITGNSADGDGGGVYTTQGISITGGTNISSNTATGSGGGIFHNADATTTVTGANIASNSATNTGGGITVGTELAANGNVFTISNSRIFGNTSTSGASGLSAGEPSSTGAGAVTATENWWGCNAGPLTAADGCDQAVLYDATNGSLSATPNIVLTLGVSPNPVNLDSTLQLDAAVNTDSSSGTVPGGPGALQGLSVAFTATVGAFSASPLATIDGTGNATTPVTPTSSGSGSATATLDNQTVTQSFTVASGAPAITSANSATFTAGTAGSFTVTTTGTPTPALSESGALPSGVAFIDNGNGTASIMGTATLAGSYPITITAQNGVAPNATQSFSLTVNPGPATYLVIPGGPEPFYTAFGFSIYAYDADNNLATSYNGTVAFTSSDPGFVNLGPVTLVNGVGSQSAVLKTAGTDSITATDTTNPSITGTGSFTIQPGPATHIGLSAPASTYAGSPISVTVTAYDLFGNVATSYGGTVTFTSTDPLAILPGSSAITNGTGTFSATMETAGTQTITATDAVNSLVATSGGISVTIPNFVVTTASDDAGAASNCTIQATPGTGTDASCSLRDALLLAANQGAGSITFDSTKFAAAKTITLTNSTLTIPTNTTIIGPTKGSGASLKNLVTVAGGGASSNFPVFTITSSAFNTAIENLIITDGNDSAGNGTAIDNGYQAALTVQNSTISGNHSSVGTGGILNDYNASLTIVGSTISRNSGTYGAIVNEPGGTLTVTESTISGNTARSNGGGGILSGGTSLTVSNSTITGNSAYSGGGINISGGTFTLTDSIVAGNTASSSDPDVNGAATDGGYNLIGDGTGLTGITNGADGDQIGTAASPLNPLLAALANYGGPTHTTLPLPGSPAICAINPSSATGADQRGLPRTTTYGATTCEDVGAVQTNYALSFTTDPAATETTGVAFPAAVTLTESRSPVSGVTIPVTLNGGGTLAGSPVSATTGTTGVASYTLTVSNPTALSNLTLTATLPSPPSITATSSDFDLSEPVPAVTALSPSSGPAAGGTTVTITGINFTGATNVKFGATSAPSFVVVSSTTIAAVAPAGTGTVDVTVTTPGGTSATSSADQYTYVSVGVTANPISAVAGTAFSGEVATFNENTGNVDPVTNFTASINWGDGTMSAGTITQPGGSGTAYVVKGNHTYVSGGSYTFTVAVTPTGGTTASNSNTATVSQVPAITSASSATFTVGTAGSFTVTTTGYPTPTISKTGPLPAGVTLSPSGVLSGTPAAGTGGSYTITIRASNGVSPNATQSFTLTVDQSPALTSASSATFTTGTAGVFRVTASGYPTPALSETGALPSGVTFVDQGNGTAFLSGTPAAGTGGAYPISIQAANGVSPSATQSFTLTVDQAPAITSAGNATFTAGSHGSFTVTTAGFPAPALSETGALPGGVTFVDNGNGTAILAGKPAGGGTYAFTITAANGVGANASQSFTLTVNFPVALTTNAISAVAETPFSGVSASFTSAANVSPVSDFTAAINWGDGTPASAGTISQPGGVGTPYSVTGGHTYAAPGSYTFTVTVTPALGTAATGTNTATVAPTPATHFMVTAPASAYVGGAFNFTVTALDAFNNATTGYNGTVHFTSTDPSAALPADGTLSNGSGTFSATLMTVGSQTITATDTVNTSLTGTSGSISVTIPSFVVENTNDSGTGSLRAALVNAANAGSGNVTFDPTVFTSAQTITLTSGTLNIPSNTTINGPTTGSGASLTNLVTVNGGGSSSNFPVFTTQSSALNATIQNVIITDGNDGGIYNGYAAVLNIQNSTISGNNSSAGTGGVFNNYNASVTIIGSTISGNTGAYGAIVSEAGGTVTVSESTISGNSATNNGGGILSGGISVIVTNSTITGNSGYSGGGIFISGGTLTLAGSIVAGNSASASYADIDGNYTDNGGNLASNNAAAASQIAADLAPLGNYGGPTQTLIPLPGSVAICATNPSTATGTDQRGLPRTTTYDATTCQDAGAVESNYSMTFSANPPADVTIDSNFSAGVTLLESNNSFVVTATPLPTVTIPLTLNGTGNLTGGSAAINDATGIATYSGLQVDQNGNDTLTASLTLNPNVTPTALSISATSSSFTVGHAATTTSASNATATYSATAQNVTLAATVTSTVGTVNAGTVTFTVLQGATPIGTAVSGSVTNGSAAASYVLPGGTTGGTYTIQAVYNGTASFATSSDSTHTLAIGKATATVTLGNLTQTYTGSPVSATATTTPAGLTVNFTYNGSTTPPTAAGSYTVVGTINSANYQGSATGTLKINQATPSITWPTPGAITYGTALSATQLDATASFNSAPVAGTFVYTPAAGTVLSAGSHTLSVAFTPTDTTDYSTPGPATTTINVNLATLDVTANSATKVYGTANPAFTGSVTGTENNDSFTESFTTTATISSNVGGYPIVPSVAGADLADYTQVVTDGTLTITQAASSTSLIASATSITPGEPLTLTATVASTTTGTPTGTVTFYDNTIPLGTVHLTNGSASYVTSALAPGIAHSISATYSGDINFKASSTTSSLTVTVAPLEFTLTINGATLQSVYPGGTAIYTFNVAPLYGSYAGTMNFDINGLPSTATATFSPDSIPANGGAQKVTLTISDAALSSAASPPTGLPKRIVPLALALLLLPLAGTRRMRRNGRKMRNMFYVLVLACSALSATVLSGCSSPNGFFAQAPKDYSLTITATAGSVQKSATVTLDVQ